MKTKRTPSLAAGERIVLRSQGGCKTNSRSGWMLGHLYLTDRRLLFSRPSGVALEVPLSEITAIAVERGKFVLRTVDVLVLSYRPRGRRGSLKVCLITAVLETWRKEIYGRSLLKVDEETILRVAGAVDPESRDILWYIWQNRYASIDELAELMGAPNHMDVLRRIKGVVNPAAERLTGYPILTFERMRIDDATGETIFSNWWISGRDYQRDRGKSELLLDIFDEANHVTVVAEFPGVQEEDIVLKVEKSRLTISVINPAGDPPQEIILPAEVYPELRSKRYNNNILEVQLAKKRSEQDKGVHNPALFSGSA